MAGIIVRGFELQFFGCGLREMLVPVYSGSKKEWLAGAVKLYAGSIRNIGKMPGASTFNKLVLKALQLH
jgi:hypothetical protein